MELRVRTTLPSEEVMETQHASLIKFLDSTIEAKKKRYKAISDSTRKKLIQMTRETGLSIKKVAKKLRINYSTAKSICQIYEREGRMEKKPSVPICRKVTKKRPLPDDENLSPEREISGKSAPEDTSDNEKKATPPFEIVKEETSPSERPESSTASHNIPQTKIEAHLPAFMSNPVSNSDLNSKLINIEKVLPSINDKNQDINGKVPHPINIQNSLMGMYGLLNNKIMPSMATSSVNQGNINLQNWVQSQQAIKNQAYMLSLLQHQQQQQQQLMMAERANMWNQNLATMNMLANLNGLVNTNSQVPFMGAPTMNPYSNLEKYNGLNLSSASVAMNNFIQKNNNTPMNTQMNQQMHQQWKF